MKLVKLSSRSGRKSSGRKSSSRKSKGRKSSSSVIYDSGYKLPELLPLSMSNLMTPGRSINDLLMRPVMSSLMPMGNPLGLGPVMQNMAMGPTDAIKFGNLLGYVTPQSQAVPEYVSASSTGTPSLATSSFASTGTVPALGSLASSSFASTGGRRKKKSKKATSGTVKKVTRKSSGRKKSSKSGRKKSSRRKSSK